MKPSQLMSLYCKLTMTNSFGCVGTTMLTSSSTHPFISLTQTVYDPEFNPVIILLALTQELQSIEY